MIEYSKRLVEVDEILNHLSKDNYAKIPIDVINYIKANKDTNYFWRYDESKKLKNQNVHDDTIAILSYLNMEYLLNNQQKKFVERLHILRSKKE